MQATIPEQLDIRSDGQTGQDEAAEQRELHRSVLLLLAALPENQQEVVRLKFQNNLSYREISGVTGLSVSNVGYLLHVAIKAIRQQLHVKSTSGAGTPGASAGE